MGPVSLQSRGSELPPKVSVLQLDRRTPNPLIPILISVLIQLVCSTVESGAGGWGWDWIRDDTQALGRAVDLCSRLGREVLSLAPPERLRQAVGELQNPAPATQIIRKGKQGAQTAVEFSGCLLSNPPGNPLECGPAGGSMLKVGSGLAPAS